MMKLKLWALPILLLCLCVSSWCSCTTESSTNYCSYSSCSIMVLSGWCPLGDHTLATLSCGGKNIPLTVSSSGNCKNGFWSGTGSLSHCQLDAFGRYRSITYDYTMTYCTTQAEADSVEIAQKCTTGTMVKDTVGATIFDACKKGEGLLIAFNNPITGSHSSSIGYYIVTDDSADTLDEATYNHLASLASTEVSLYRGVLNGKYVYWYSTDPEPAGVINAVRIK